MNYIQQGGIFLQSANLNYNQEWTESAATNGTEDVTKFSPAAYNAALGRIGERKLTALGFSAEEIERKTGLLNLLVFKSTGNNWLLSLHANGGRT